MRLIDPDLILSIVDGDRQEARSLMGIFFDSAREQVAQMAASVQADDREALARAAHQIAGAAGTCGFSELERRFRDIEVRAGEEGPCPGASDVEEIRSLVTAAEVQAQEAFPAEDSPA